MKKFAAVLAVAMALSAGVASAQDMMQSAYGNTFVATTAAGAVIRYHFNADGTFDYVTPDNQTVAGSYTVADNQICMTVGSAQPACVPYIGEKHVGETWTQTASDGSQISVMLVAGR